MKFGTWNVRTLMDNPNSDRPERRTAFIARELQRFNFDIVALSETRRPGEGQLREEQGQYTFFWKGLNSEQRRIHGVGFAIRNSILPKLTEQPVEINERLMVLRIQLVGNQQATIISAYAPTLDAEDTVKEMFYAQLDNLLSSAPKKDKIILLGDFNARVGKDHLLWTGTIGKEGVGKVNDNGTLLLTKCAEHNLVITNTLFRQKNKHKVSWQHPRSKHWHLIDYIIVRACDQQDVLKTRAVTGADESWTDHRLISSIMRIKLPPKGKHQNKNSVKKFNLTPFEDRNLTKMFQQKLGEKLPETIPSSVKEHWDQLKTAITSTCTDTLGTKKRKHQDWFDDNDEQLQQLIDKKRKAFVALQSDQKSASKRKDYQKCKAAVQKTTRDVKNKWWKEKALEIQHLADKKDIRGFFEATNAIYGPSTRGQVPLKSKDGSTILKSNADIKSRWKEHFDDLLNQTVTFDRNLVGCLPRQPIVNSLSETPTIAEVEEAISTMKNNKAAGLDGIPAEIFKYGGNKLLSQLHQLLVNIWIDEELPADLKDASIVTIYKRKGDRSECGNYRGISLLSTAGKVLARILNNRLRPLAERVLPETQCGFRPARGTTDMIFSIRQLQEKCREQQQPLYMAFIDLTKAFDSVSRELLWDVLSAYGCPEKFICVLRLLHDDMRATVKVGSDNSDPFQVKSGVKQGCVIAPTLFSIFIATIIHLIKEDLPPGIELVYRTDGSIFNLARLKATTKTSTSSIVEFQYADDNCVAALSESNLQKILTAFNNAYSRLGLTVNSKKTKVVYQPSPSEENPSEPTITLDEAALENVNHFPYLGSHLSSSVDIDDEIQYRLKCAATAYGRLRKRVFQDHDIRIATKVLVYKAIVITTLLYASETWTTYRRHLKTLEKFHQRCLRNIMNVSWEDRRTNVSVLEEAQLTSIEALIIRNQLRWSGHVVRMSEDRLPKQIFYSELKEGSRKRGGQKKRYKDTLKASLKNCNININSWEDDAKDRDLWRAMADEGTASFETNRRANLEQKRLLRKEKEQQPRSSDLPSGTTCPHCHRTFKARIGLISHLRVHKQSN